jgi:hypothetical protein
MTEAGDKTCILLFLITLLWTQSDEAITDDDNDEMSVSSSIRSSIATKLYAKKLSEQKKTTQLKVLESLKGMQMNPCLLFLFAEIAILIVAFYAMY